MLFRSYTATASEKVINYFPQFPKVAVPTYGYPEALLGYRYHVSGKNFKWLGANLNKCTQCVLNNAHMFQGVGGKSWSWSRTRTCWTPGSPAPSTLSPSGAGQTAHQTWTSKPADPTIIRAEKASSKSSSAANMDNNKLNLFIRVTNKCSVFMELIETEHAVSRNANQILFISLRSSG